MSDMVVVSKVIAVPPEVIWEIMTDVEHYPAVFRSITEVSREGGAEYGPGSTWQEVVNVGIRSLTLSLECLEMKEHSHTVQRSFAKEGETLTRRDLIAVPGGTSVTVSIESVTNDQHWLARVLGKAVGAVTRKVVQDVIERDLEDLEKAALRG